MPLTRLIEPQTDRLQLRQWLPADRAPFAALNADPRVAEFLPATLSRADSDALADRLEAFIAAYGWGSWAAELKASGQLIGFVGLGVPSLGLPVSPCVEIRWRLAHRFWGKGYATEAAREALRVGFETLALPEIVSFSSVLHLRSRAVMARLGMTEAPETFEHPSLPLGHRLREHCVYQVSSEAWTAHGCVAPAR